MPPLNLPQYVYKYYEHLGKSYIFDPIRKKYVFLSKEEWVRQHVINFLLLKGYPKGLIRVEKKLRLYKRFKRPDILVYNSKMKPFLLVELKSYTKKIDKTTFFQTARYNSVLQVPFFMLSNGLKHLFLKMDYENKTCLKIEDLPNFGS